MAIAVDAWREPVEQRPRVAGRRARVPVGGRALLVDRLEVEQVGRGLGHQADQPPACLGAQVGRVRSGDAHRSRRTTPGALERPQQGRLARAVAAHHRDHLAPVEGQVDRAQRGQASVGDGHAAGPQEGLGCPLAARPAPVRARVHEHEVAGGPAGVAHRQRQRRPAGPATELDDGGYDGRLLEHRGRITGPDDPVALHQHHPVGERHHPLEPVLGQDHADAEVVHQPGQRRQHVLGSGRVEGRGGLVEHEHARMHRQHRPDRDPLLLPAGEGAQVAVAQVGDAQQVEGLLDAATHRGRLEPELLHPVGQLLLDGVGDEAGGRVLPDVADDVRALARRTLEDADAVEEHVAGEDAAGERGHQPVQHARAASTCRSRCVPPPAAAPPPRWTARRLGAPARPWPCRRR